MLLEHNLLNNLNIFKKRHRFCLPTSQSPTYLNIARALKRQGWHSTRFQWRANFSERNLDFDLAAAQTLEFKHLLALLIAKHGREIMPPTFYINDHNYREVLALITDEYYKKNDHVYDQIDHLIWILKPSLQNNGQNIKIYQRLSELHQHFLNPRRLGGDHVLQRYLINPHLLNGHKYSIRMFVILTNDMGGYLYPYGYFNVARKPYQLHNFKDLSSHITNEHLRIDEPNVIQIPTTRGDFFPALYPNIKFIIGETLRALRAVHSAAFQAEHHHRERKLAFFGFDFMVDSAFNVWLLEVNHGPCFPTHPDHVLQRFLYDDFWQAVVNTFVTPIAQKQPISKIDFSSFDCVLNLGE